MKTEFQKESGICSDCGKKAKTGWIIEGKFYAEQCAANLLGLTLSSLRKLKPLDNNK